MSKRAERDEQAAGSEDRVLAEPDPEAKDDPDRDQIGERPQRPAAPVSAQGYVGEGHPAQHPQRQGEQAHHD